MLSSYPPRPPLTVKPIRAATLTCGRRRYAQNTFTMPDAGSYDHHAVCHQFLPELPLALARHVCRSGDTSRPDDGLRYVPSPRHPVLFPSPTYLPISPVIGKAEGSGTERHGHVTALSVAPEYRRLGVSRRFMAWLEKVSDENYRGLFVDLYVRCVNFAAIQMYEGMGYSVYRRVREYYSNLGLGHSVRDEEDGFGASFVSSVLACDAHLERRYAETATSRSHAEICTIERTRHRRQRERGTIVRVRPCNVNMLHLNVFIHTTCK